MLEKYYPYEYVENVFCINYKKLYKLNYRGIIFDIDNTLVHHGDNATPEVEELFRSLHYIGFKTLLLTNNDEERVQRFLKNITSLYICDAGKPDPKNYLKAVKKLGLKKKETLFIGDQIFTDILGANKSGIANILVKFIQLNNEKKIGIRRHLEKLILTCYKKSRTFQHRFGKITIDQE